MDVPFSSGGDGAHGEAWVTFPGTASWEYPEGRSHGSRAADAAGIGTGQSQEALRVLPQWGPPPRGAETASTDLGHLARQGPEPRGLGCIKNPG